MKAIGLFLTYPDKFGPSANPIGSSPAILLDSDLRSEHRKPHFGCRFPLVPCKTHRCEIGSREQRSTPPGVVSILRQHRCVITGDIADTANMVRGEIAGAATDLVRPVPCSPRHGGSIGQTLFADDGFTPHDSCVFRNRAIVLSYHSDAVLLSIIGKLRAVRAHGQRHQLVAGIPLKVRAPSLVRFPFASYENVVVEPVLLISYCFAATLPLASVAVIATVFVPDTTDTPALNALSPATPAGTLHCDRRGFAHRPRECQLASRLVTHQSVQPVIARADHMIVDLLCYSVGRRVVNANPNRVNTTGVGSTDFLPAATSWSAAS